MCVGPEAYWDPQGPDFSNCTSPWVNLISQKVNSCNIELVRNSETTRCGLIRRWIFAYVLKYMYLGVRDAQILILGPY